MKCFRELVQYGAQGVLEREYGPYIVSPEPGYDFSILVDLNDLPEDAEAKEDLIRRISLLKRNAMAAPFERAFDEFSQLKEEASKYTSESAPQGIEEGGEVMAIHYREEEAIYIKASHDRVTVIFSTVFRDETDRIFGKVFLQVRWMAYLIELYNAQHYGTVSDVNGRNSSMPEGEQFRMPLRSSSATSLPSNCKECQA